MPNFITGLGIGIAVGFFIGVLFFNFAAKDTLVDKPNISLHEYWNGE